MSVDEVVTSDVPPHPRGTYFDDGETAMHNHTPKFFLIFSLFLVKQWSKNSRKRVRWSVVPIAPNLVIG